MLRNSYGVSSGAPCRCVASDIACERMFWTTRSASRAYTSDSPTDSTGFVKVVLAAEVIEPPPPAPPWHPPGLRKPMISRIATMTRAGAPAFCRQPRVLEIDKDLDKSPKGGSKLWHEA